MSEKKLLRLPQVMELTAAARSTIWKWVKDGEFPQPIKLSPRVTAWKLSEVEAWIESKVKEHQVQGAK